MITTRKLLTVLSIIWWRVTVHTCYVFKQIVNSVNSIYNRQFRSIVANIAYRFIISLPVTRLITGNHVIQLALLHGFWVLRHKVNTEIGFSICRHQRLGMLRYTKFSIIWISLTSPCDVDFCSLQNKQYWFVYVLSPLAEVTGTMPAMFSFFSPFLHFSAT